MCLEGHVVGILVCVISLIALCKLLFLQSWDENVKHRPGELLNNADHGYGLFVAM